MRTLYHNIISAFSESFITPLRFRYFEAPLISEKFLVEILQHLSLLLSRFIERADINDHSICQWLFILIDSLQKCCFANRLRNMILNLLAVSWGFECKLLQRIVDVLRGN